VTILILFNCTRLAAPSRNASQQQAINDDN
jgi:hypothetical protein